MPAAQQEALRVSRRLNRLERLREEAGKERDRLDRLDALVKRVGDDFGLAADCLTMRPRPAWVSEMLGYSILDLSSLDLT
jgi:hypothetical protein